MSEAYVGEIRLFAGNFAPMGWHLCDGTMMNINANETLYSLIGTTYGGDGQNTFALPDLRGRLAIGQGNGPGLSPHVMGERFGVDAVTLTMQQVPAHSHAISVSTAEATSPSPKDALFAKPGDDKLYISNPGNPQFKALSRKTVTPVGGGEPHPNTMPSVGMNYIICLEGIYPQKA